MRATSIVLPLFVVFGATMVVFGAPPPRSTRQAVASLSTGDRDGDGVPDSQDCDPDDAELWAIPAEAQGLTLSGKNPTTFSWQPSSPSGGLYARYDLLRSGSASDFSLANCTVSESDSLTAQISDP